jgi:hypothetical protein
MGSLTRVRETPEPQVNHGQEILETRQESSPEGEGRPQGQVARNEEAFARFGAPDSPGEEEARHQEGIAAEDFEQSSTRQEANRESRASSRCGRKARQTRCGQACSKSSS